MGIPGTLYLVGTPIGNLGDLSPRGAQVLGEVDFIAAEDTRVSLKLLNHLGIKKPMVSYFEHNIRQRGEIILTRLQGGESCAVITDAGMPCISDPGQDLVRICAEGGIPTVVVPGPSAVVSAVALSGLPGARFTFEGFLSVGRGARQRHLEELLHEKRLMVFYEAPHKLLNTLRDFAESFGGERRLALLREMTKLHEECLRMSLEEAVCYYETHPPKGEFVLVLEGCGEQEEASPSLEEAVALVKERVADGVSLSDAAREVAKMTPYKKSELYKGALEGKG